VLGVSVGFAAHQPVSLRSAQFRLGPVLRLGGSAKGEKKANHNRNEVENDR